MPSKLSIAFALTLALSASTAVGLVWAQEPAAAIPAETPTEASAALSFPALREGFEASSDAAERAALLARIEALAPEGEARVLLWLGDLYRTGEQVPADPVRAAAFYEQAAGSGDLVARFRFGNALLTGSGVAAEAERGLALMEEGAAAGRGWMLARLGDVLARGEAVEPDPERAIAYYERAAEVGEVNALNRLGDLYRIGEALPADPARAAGYYERAAEAGDAVGQFRFGDALLAGRGIAADPARGLALMEEGAGERDWMLARIGDVLARGEGVETDAARAAGYYERAAAAGNAAAAVRLGDLYRDGAGVPADPARAVALYEQASEAGNTTAATRLGEAYLAGTGVAVDAERGLSLLEEAGAFMRLGQIFRDGVFGTEDGSRAVSYYRQAAEAGNAEGYVRIADMQRDGSGVRRDVAEARRNYRRAAEAGFARAAVIDGENDASGRYGAASDPARGFQAVRDAARANEPSAPSVLADLYVWGRGTERDPALALRTLTEAADAGNAQAIRTLVAYRRDGRGSAIARDPAEARALLSRYASRLDAADQARETFLVTAALGAGGYAGLAETFDGFAPDRRPQLLRQLRATNPNLYVYVLQRALAERGLYPGPANGLLTAGTIRSVTAFCRQEGANGACGQGPLSPAAAQFLSARLV